MTKILIITEIFYPENGLINDFVLELVKLGYQVDVLTQYPSYPEGKVFKEYKNCYYTKEIWNQITIHRFKVIEGYATSKIKKIINYFIFVSIGKKIAKKIGKNYDHILAYQTGPLTLVLPGVYIKKKYKIPLTTWTFDIWPDAVYAYGFPRIFPLTWFLNFIIRKVYRNSDNIFVSSKQFIDVIQPYVPNKTIIYAPNWLVEEKQKVSNIKLNKEKLNFTFAGNISISQNLEKVLLGWKKAHLKNVNLNIIGSGSKFEEIKKLIKDQGIQNVKIYGRYPSNQIQHILNQSDILILSLVANHGIEKTEPYKFQSYLNAGKPIFGIISGSACQIIEENILGVCANPNDVHAISIGFSQIIDFIKKYDKQEISNRAKKLLTHRFNKSQIIKTILSTIDNEKK